MPAARGARSACNHLAIAAGNVRKEFWRTFRRFRRPPGGRRPVGRYYVAELPSRWTAPGANRCIAMTMASPRAMRAPQTPLPGFGQRCVGWVARSILPVMGLLRARSALRFGSRKTCEQSRRHSFTFEWFHCSDAALALATNSLRASRCRDADAAFTQHLRNANA
jgi:hypothetical protein